ncbi:6-carboxyhexanoate--CoA ligase [Desulfovibrio sp.]|uniref:6-carboxyhexanoate--CoA ligase n=1 Tax=Desulfovibrio sp. TaxID=885 RepID=UPI0023D0B2C6|nr:6-carboxyhexanoate--CoA ligase [Desulfovibrio sp.]MDE7241570.1 aminotransferase class I/II-fold pyridoxal phosphate-dependent enzyme [Desulfovibrio sp.]
MPLYSIRMRASRARPQARPEHVSGAERIGTARAVPALAAELATRALGHPKGTPDSIHISIEALDEGALVRIPALPARALACADAGTGLRLAEGLLREAGATRPGAVIDLLLNTPPLRGAMLVDADTLERLEPDRERGVRATRMDMAEGAALPPAPDGKQHYREAAVLAAKVCAAPHILAELCISDDPDYVTGYVAAPGLGYVRIQRLKEPGSPRGGRIFLYRGPREAVAATVGFLERQPVLVENVPPPPPFAEETGAEKSPSQPGRLAFVEEELAAIAARGLYRSMEVCESAPAARVRQEGRELLLLASGDYLGLAGDTRVKAAAAEALAALGAGTGGSRLTTGTLPLHVRLEKELAAFGGSEEALLFSSGYAANLGVLQALCGRGDVIFSDELNHASIIDGCRLSGAQVIVYPHKDMAALDRMALEHQGRRRVVVSDAVFSMDGDVADLPGLMGAARRHGLITVLDEAHALGVIGRTGRGIVEHFGPTGPGPDIFTGSLSKALGADGGYMRGPAGLMEWLRHTGRSFVFSTALSAAPAGAALAALHILRGDPGRVARLQENAAFFRACLRGHGVEPPGETAIVPLLAGDERQAVDAARALREAGILISAIRYPTVARGCARLRAALRADHERADLARAAAEAARALIRARPELPPQAPETRRHC